MANTRKTQTATKPASTGRRSLSFVNVNTGVQAAIDGNTLWVKADLSKAQPSKGKAQKHIVHTSGWAELGNGFAFNMMATNGKAG